MHLFSILGTRLPRNRVGTVLGALSLSLMGFLVIGIFWLLVEGELYQLSYAIVGIILIYISVNANKRTAFGDKMLTKLLGFKQFITHAEKDRINQLVYDNPGYFYKVLPYAMILGVTDKWAKQFEHIALSQPPWYESHRHYPFLALYFTRHLDNITKDINHSMT